MTVASAAGSGSKDWARFGRLAWAVTALLSVGLVAADFPYRFDQLRTYCVTVCEASRLPATEAPALQRLALTLDTYASLIILLYLALAVVCWGVAALIMWRRSGERVTELASIALVALGSSAGMTLQTVLPFWRPVFVLLLLGGFICLVYLFYLFPDGRFVPRWTRWMFAPWALWLGAGLASAVLLRRPLSALFWLVLTVLTLALFAVGGLAQIYRFARASNPLQRQQTKWVVAGFAWLIVSDVAWTAYTNLVLPALGLPQPAGAVFELASSALDVVSLILVPVTLGIAILRYRLWDIDVLIRRTLIYAVLTALLALAYFGSVLALQTAFSAVTGQRQSTLVTVLSTLVIAALFVPLRRRVQAAIDQQFYRRHYDAARTLAAFGATLRDETNLDQLMAYLTGVVDETMQPTIVGVSLVATPRSKP